MNCTPTYSPSSCCPSCGERHQPGVAHRPVIDCTIPHRQRLVATILPGHMISVNDLLMDRTVWHAPKQLDSDVYRDPEGLTVLRLDSELKYAHLISSQTEGRDHVQRPVIDVDDWNDDALAAIIKQWPALADEPDKLVVIPSANPGHVHVYVQLLDGELGVAQALMELAAAGVVEPGYALASIRRHCAHVRPPWAPKGVHPPIKPAAVPVIDPLAEAF